VKVLAYESFKDFYARLPSHIQRKANKQLRLLAQNPRHPSLQVKRIRGTASIWEARVDRQYRLSFEMVGDTIYLRAVGNHDEVLRRP